MFEIKTMYDTYEKAKLLDQILQKGIEYTQKRRETSIVDLQESFNIDQDEANDIIEFLAGYYWRSSPIIESFDSSQFFDTNYNTRAFLDEGGFAKVFETELKKQQDQEEREKLEIEALKLGPKQHRFNKISVIINFVLTLITIVLSILIAKGMIG